MTFTAADQWDDTDLDGEYDGDGPRVAGRGQRRWGGALLGLLLAVLGAGGALWLGSGSQPTVDAVALARPMQRGQVIAAADLAVVRVAASGGAVRLATPAIARAAVVGRQALVDLPAGTLLTPELVGSIAGPAGTLTLGVAVDAAGLPSSSPRPGEQVDVVGVDPATKDAVTLAQRVTVTEVGRPAGSSEAGVTVVYLAVPAELAARVAAAAATSPGVRLLGVTADTSGGAVVPPDGQVGGPAAAPTASGAATGGAGTGSAAGPAAGASPAAADGTDPSGDVGAGGADGSTAGGARPSGASPSASATGGVAGVVGAGG
ncbi:SAF domain-containing protein [Pseudofrankia sp. BMG5.37]|uniref:SAF domain-containing protein n=1 Tax=Pseudofrankia sp. BMG5.37 TaxID=3050035 RepID=UPI002894A856|nr:SAF domain-containing protein [Pseudofrankia sp. BMG5.37]MDT3446426.1 SAF domain-containing protein [Pseudofrankia sp. BMG5.37]